MISNYLQSLTWQKVCQANFDKTSILEGKKETNLDFFSLLIEKKVRLFGSFLYCPRGPIFKSRESLELWQLILSSYLKEGKKNKSIFLKLDPGLVDIELFKKAAQSLKLEIRKTKAVQPQQTICLDLSLSEDELLKEMKSKTRYNIKLALKNDLELSDDKEDFEEFFQLLSSTKERDNFRLHPKSHYLNLINNGISLISIKKDNVILAAGLFSFYKDTVTYLHGASNYEQRSKMAPYLLHFEIIKKAKKMNFKYYDLYGIDEKKWPGVTRFKRGFGGFELHYPDSYDIVINKNIYFFYHNIKNIKQLLRWK